MTKTAEWYLEEDPAESLVSTVRNICDAQQWQDDADIYHAELYGGGTAAAGLRAGSRGGYDYSPSTLPYNVVRQSVDARTARVGKNRPLPKAQSSHGSWKDRKRAKKLTQCIEAEFSRLKVFAKHAPRTLRDAQVYSRGAFLKVFQEGKRVCAEVCDPLEIKIDDWDGRYGDPRSMYQVRTVDAGKLKSLFPDAADEIDTATGDTDDRRRQADGWESTVKRVEVYEGWHLCDCPDDDDDHEDCSGRHTIAIKGKTLLDEDKCLTRFPFARLTYTEPISGWRAQGLAERLEGYQYEINLMAESVSRAHYLTGSHIVLNPEGSGLDYPDFVNGVGHVINHAPGLKPEFVNPQPVHPQTYERLRDLVRDALADGGQSEMSVHGQKPAGITAAVAMQQIEDMESEASVMFARRYEAWCIDVAELVIETMKDIAEECSEYETQYLGKDGLVPLKWSDVRLDTYELRVFSSSVLPNSPAARLQKLQELYNNNLIERDVFMREFETTDLGAELDLELADKMWVDECIESFLDADDPADPDVYIAPTPYQNLEWALKRGQQKLHQAMRQRAPEENLELVRQYIADCEEEMAAQAPPTPAPMPGGGDPAAMAGGFGGLPQPLPPGADITMQGPGVTPDVG